MCVEIHRERLSPCVVGKIVDQAMRVIGGVIHHDIGSSKAAVDLNTDTIPIGVLRHVGGDAERRFADPRRGLGGIANVHQHELRAPFCKFYCDRLAYAMSGPRDYGDATVVSSRHRFDSVLNHHLPTPPLKSPAHRVTVRRNGRRK